MLKDVADEFTDESRGFMEDGAGSSRVVVGTLQCQAYSRDSAKTGRGLYGWCAQGRRGCLG